MHGINHPPGRCDGCAKSTRKLDGLKCRSFPGLMIAEILMKTRTTVRLVPVSLGGGPAIDAWYRGRALDDVQRSRIFTVRPCRRARLTYAEGARAAAPNLWASRSTRRMLLHGLPCPFEPSRFGITLASAGCPRPGRRVRTLPLDLPALVPPCSDTGTASSGCSRHPVRRSRGKNPRECANGRCPIPSAPPGNSAPSPAVRKCRKCAA